MAFKTKVVVFVMEIVFKKLIECSIGMSATVLKACSPRSLETAGCSPLCYAAPCDF